VIYKFLKDVSHFTGLQK